MELKFPTRFVLKKGMIANMKKNNENGFAVTDIAISLVVVFMFASLISILVYNFNIRSITTCYTRNRKYEN